MTNSNNTPVDRIREGNLEIAIWANHTEKGIRYTTDGVFRKYTDQEGKWKKTRSLSNGEMLRGSQLMDLAFSRAVEVKAAESEANNT